MKKEMFNTWYNAYGKELAKNALPIDDVEEKEIRKKAKEIFSYTYGLFSEFMCDRLRLIEDYIFSALNNLDNCYEEYSVKKHCAELLKRDLKPYTTELYDAYYKDKCIDEKTFMKMKAHFGGLLSQVKQTIRSCDEDLIEIKKERKLIESLLVNE